MHDFKLLSFPLPETKFCRGGSQMSLNSYISKNEIIEFQSAVIIFPTNVIFIWNAKHVADT